MAPGSTGAGAGMGDFAKGGGSSLAGEPGGVVLASVTEADVDGEVLADSGLSDAGDGVVGRDGLT